MNRFDHFALDGRLPAMFVTVYQLGSVTAAARSLGMSQSSLSNGLNRLRAVTGDELFVPLGRGITPTARADELIDEARWILDAMERFVQAESYDPASDEAAFSIAASDYEIELVINPLARQLREQAPGLQLVVMRAYSQDEWASLLRRNETDLVLSVELKSEETDLIQQRIITHDRDICYFNAAHRGPPDTLDRYCAAHHIIMSPHRFRKTEVDRTLAELGRDRHIAMSLPSFSMVASLLRGTDCVALMPSNLQNTTFRGFASCPVPFEQPAESIAQTWHIRSSASPRHRWIRAQKQSICATRTRKA